MADAILKVRDGEHQGKFWSLKLIDQGDGTFAFASELTVADVAIGKLAANSGVDIGDVDVTSCATADGANVILGTKADAAVVTDATGTIHQYLRGLVKFFADIPSVKIDQTTPGTTDAVTLKASELHLGQVAGTSSAFEVTLSLDTNIYASGDVLADRQVLTAIMRKNGGTGVIHSVVLLDKDDQGGALDLVFLKTDVTIGTENAAVSVSDANADEIQGVVEIASGDYVDLVGSQLVTKTNVGIVVEADSGADDLYIAAISRDAKTYTASGITVKVGILLD